jgi:hypothetical protein
VRIPRPPTIAPASGGSILDWARQAQQSLRDISAAFGEITIPRPRAVVSSPVVAAALQSLELVNASDESAKKIRVVYGTIAGESPTGFADGDDPHYVLTVTGSGVVYGGISIDSEGAITARWVDRAAELPEDTDTDFHVVIGTFSIDSEILSIAQGRYGPIDVQICRNWYAASAPFFGVNWS